MGIRYLMDHDQTLRWRLTESLIGTGKKGGGRKKKSKSKMKRFYDADHKQAIKARN